MVLVSSLSQKAPKGILVLCEELGTQLAAKLLFYMECPIAGGVQRGKREFSLREQGLKEQETLGKVTW